MSSETSSDNNINYLDNNGKKIVSEIKKETKKQTSDTDFYFDMVANKEKIVVQTLEESESSDIKISNSSSSSSKSKSSSSKSSSSKSSTSTKKPNVETFNFSNDMNGGNNKFNNTTHFSNNNSVNQTNIPNISSLPILSTKTLPVLDPTINVKVLTPQEVRIKKIELLRRLSEIKMKGYNLTKEYDFNSSIEEMEYEYALLKSFADKRNGIKLYKSFLLNTVSLVEFANDKYDPFDFKLEGWSEHMSVEVDSWDDVLEELYEKYKTSGGNWPVELKLALLIVGSGAGYHFTKSQFGGLPSGMGAGSLLGKMMSDNKKPSQFMTPQEINLENQKKMMKEREMLLKQQQKDKIKSSVTSETEPINNSQIFNLGNLFGQNTQPVNNNQSVNNNNQSVNNNNQPVNNNNQSVNNNNQPVNNNNQPVNNKQSVNNNTQSFNIQHPSSQFNIPQSISKGNSRDIPEIRAPDNVAEILSRIKNIQSQANINTTETQEENSSNNDRLLSDVTLSASDLKKRGKKSTKKPLISINT